ncbi:hypothetical protein [Pedobacter namyangjuensis]|uniref:hypothetical protein n=1 Tax=Pedobacter namyangjuensis TaxID=600626 RepID=UPI000DE24C5F|nr:hypothetical protein [Pedobacter namyangjuensis]
MVIITLRERPENINNVKLNGLYLQFANLLAELRTKQLNSNLISSINSDVEEINDSLFVGDDLKKLVKQKQTSILKRLEKEFKFTPRNYYRNLWMVLGLSAFGLPIGMIFGFSIGNIGLMGVGLPIGMAVGAVVGTAMDKKALDNGTQLDLEIKY